MRPFFLSIQRHLGVSAPLFLIFAAVVLVATGGEVDTQVIWVLALVFLATLLTPVAISRVNHRQLRNGFSSSPEAGEQILHEGPADRYEVGHVGWLFLTNCRFVLYRLGAGEEWSVSLAEVLEVSSARYAGLFATDIRIALRDGTVEKFRVEASDEWVQKARGAVQLWSA